MKEHNEKYEMVEHPKHYNTFQVESIDMIERTYGVQWTYIAADITARLYQDRMGTKPDNSVEQEVAKRDWWLKKRDEMRAKMTDKEYEKVLLLLPSKQQRGIV